MPGVLAIAIALTLLACSKQMFEPKNVQELLTDDSGVQSKACCSDNPYRVDVAPTDDMAKVFARLKNLNHDDRKNGVEVVFAPGEYRFRSSVLLQAGHSGRIGADVVLRAEKAGTVRFTGGFPLEPASFHLVSDDTIRARFKPSVRDRVLACDISPYINGELKPWPDAMTVPPGPWLYIDDEPATIARYPNDEWIYFTKAARTGFELEKDKPDTAGLKTPGPGALYWEGDSRQVKSWDFARGVWLYGYWTHDWAEQFLKAGSLSETSSNLVINLKGVHKYGIKGGYTLGSKKRRYFVLNLPEELDAPGEFWIDRSQKMLYLMPPAGFETKRLMIATLDRPFFRSAHDDPVHDIRFENLVLADAHALGFAIDMESDRVRFESCTFSNLGGAGVSFRGNGNCLTGCVVRTLGSMAVKLSGGDSKTLVRAANAVVDCDISHYARFSRTYMPAVDCSGVGQEVMGCRIHDAPHQAIRYSGQDHRFLGNDISRVLTETSDSGAVYMGRRTDTLGTVVEGNHFHDLGSGNDELDGHTYAVYFDDCGWGTDVLSNIFERVGCGILIGGGNLHRIEGNIFLDCRCGIRCGSRGRTWPKSNGMFCPDQKTGVSWFESWLLRHDYKRGMWKKRFPQLEGLLADRPDLPRMNPIVGNTFSRCKIPMCFDELALSVTNEMPVVRNSITEWDERPDLLSHYRLLKR